MRKPFTSYAALLLVAIAMTLSLLGSLPGVVVESAAGGRADEAHRGGYAMKPLFQLNPITLEGGDI